MKQFLKIRKENSVFAVVIGTILGISYWMELSANLRLILVVIAGVIFGVVWEAAITDSSEKEQLSFWKKAFEFIFVLVIAVTTSIVVEYILNFIN